jgi:hypothetical protein
MAIDIIDVRVPGMKERDTTAGAYLPTLPTYLCRVQSNHSNEKDCVTDRFPSRGMGAWTERLQVVPPPPPPAASCRNQDRRGASCEHWMDGWMDGGCAVTRASCGGVVSR